MTAQNCKQTGAASGLLSPSRSAWHLHLGGVPVTLNSDDPCIQHGTINDEYDVAVTCWGYSLNDLLRLERNAVGAAFLPEEEKDVLLERVEKGYQECCGQGLA